MSAEWRMGRKIGQKACVLRQVQDGEIWQYLRANHLSNRVFVSCRVFVSSHVFETYDDLIDAAREAWNKLVAAPATITSIGLRA
jgi:hypothetical protein